MINVIQHYHHDPPNASNRIFQPMSVEHVKEEEEEKKGQMMLNWYRLFPNLVMPLAPYMEDLP